MAKPEWGVKRTCTSCGARFYDLTKTPIVCPKCDSVVEPELPFKVRRTAEKAKAKVAVVAEVADEALETEADDLVDGDEAVTEEAEEDEMIEDASDLGGDDDDMAEVMEHLDEDIEDEV